MLKILQSLAVLICFWVSACVGWGTRFEVANNSGRKFASRRAMVANENNHDQFENSSEDPMTSIIETSIHIHDYIHLDNNNPHDLLDLVKDRAEELARETFAGYTPSLEPACSGEDCDTECLIPEEWSLTAGDMDSTEVMSFLGIQRARPLHRPADWD
jgi:hypothetical protein